MTSIIARGRISLLLLCFLAIFSHSVYASVLAIDYGTDWIKASLMKPGVPFDVLLNKDSKRKIQASVAWKTDDRLFGADAAGIASRFPTDSFSSLKFLQATPFNSEAVSFFTSISTAEVVETSRKTVALRRNDGTEWSVEELIAMQLAYVKELAETLAGEKVHDVIIAIPPFYSQFERDAVADAIEIAGLRTLALVNDGTAVAVNYAMTRTFATPEYHVIYDAGASSIRATVASFTTIAGEDKDKGKDTTHISVAGVGYDRKTGGTELDRRLRDILVDDFIKKHRKDIRTNKRGMARLWKEAGRVKAILSANQDSRVAVESIAWDIDYKSLVKRSDFEKACADLKPRFAQPIVDALANAGITLDQVSSVILTGGSTRTPMIRNAVKDLVGEQKVAVNVNADEAAVLASLSRQFKTKDIKVTDITLHDIQVSYPGEKSEKTLSSVIFPAGSKTGTKKTMTFKRKDDFGIKLSYRQSPAPGFPTHLLEARVIGVSAAIANLTERGVVDPVVKATVSLSESGFASVKDAIVYGEVKDDTISGKLKSLLGNGPSESDGSQEETATEGVRDPTSTSSSTTLATSGSASGKDAKPTMKEHSIALAVDVQFLTIPPMTVTEKRAARDRLVAVDQKESIKRRKSDARNSLESYLYRLRDLLDDNSPGAPFTKCSKASERKEISKKLGETISWLNEEGDEADMIKLLDKRSALESLERPIIHRYQEIEEFPKALNISQMWNWHTRMFLTDARANLTAEEATGQPSKYTVDDLAGLEKTLREHETWLAEWVERQKPVAMNEDPVIQTSEMKARAKTLENHLQRLVKRKIAKPKKTTTSSTSVPTESAESLDTESQAQSTSSKHDEL